MILKKPYLIRAIYEWIVDCEFTPYIAVDTSCPQVQVPEQYIKCGVTIFDISDNSAKDLMIDNEAATFKAQFNCVAHSVYLPIKSIISIYASENNNGMSFIIEEKTSNNKEILLSRQKLELKVISGGRNSKYIVNKC